jgi:hypothetical protein
MPPSRVDTTAAAPGPATGIRAPHAPYGGRGEKRVSWRLCACTG